MTQLQALALTLLKWWDAGHADLPWRHTRDPYAIWIAEIMLQQTQIKTVIPYYERWLVRFPTVSSLAAASLDQVLSLCSTEERRILVLRLEGLEVREIAEDIGVSRRTVFRMLARVEDRLSGLFAA